METDTLPGTPRIALLLAKLQSLNNEVTQNMNRIVKKLSHLETTSEEVPTSLHRKRRFKKKHNTADLKERLEAFEYEDLSFVSIPESQ